MSGREPPGGMGNRSGRVVSVPERKHECAPGWRDYYAEEDDLGTRAGWYSAPPDVSDFPRGTVWQCPCGRTWVSLGGRGVADFRREGHWARRRRERKMLRGDQP